MRWNKLHRSHEREKENMLRLDDTCSLFPLKQVYKTQLMAIASWLIIYVDVLYMSC